MAEVEAERGGEGGVEWSRGAAHHRMRNLLFKTHLSTGWLTDTWQSEDVRNRRAYCKIKNPSLAGRRCVTVPLTTTWKSVDSSLLCTTCELWLYTSCFASFAAF